MVLISPFTSIKDAAKHTFGSIGSSIIKQRFDNLGKIESVKCPCLFIHGKEDSLIPYEHSKTLYTKCNRPAEILIYAGMTHQQFDAIECVAMPTVKFMEKADPLWHKAHSVLQVPKFLFITPKVLEKYVEQKSRESET